MGIEGSCERVIQVEMLTNREIRSSPQDIAIRTSKGALELARIRLKKKNRKDVSG